MWVAILFREKEIDLLPLMFFGIEFQRFAPSYILLVLGLGQKIGYGGGGGLGSGGITKNTYVLENEAFSQLSS